MSEVGRCSTWEELAVTTTPLASPPIDDTKVALSIVASGDDSWRPLASAVATMQRPRRSEHEELWAQLFVDSGFVDVVRALEVGTKGPDAVFLARFRVPDVYLDGRVHRARIRFVPAVSRAVPRGTGGRLPYLETARPIEVEAEFVAALSPARARRVAR